jgi:hypothetical protein
MAMPPRPSSFSTRYSCASASRTWSSSDSSDGSSDVRPSGVFAARSSPQEGQNFADFSTPVPQREQNTRNPPSSGKVPDAACSVQHGHHMVTVLTTGQNDGPNAT